MQAEMRKHQAVL